jgi:EmrB/QacA subfamily drug resistance transporter
MTTLDSSIVNIGLPSIARAFGVPLSGTIEWVLIGYLVVIAAFLLSFGRLADMLGRKPLFLAGLAVFTLGSALCGAAPSLGALIAARCFQGLGAAAIFSVNVAMITRSFPASERGRALGTNAILVALGVSAGPTVGGILTHALSWRWIFYVNLPIGVFVIVAAWHLLTERPRWERQHFDLPGAAFLAAALSVLTLGLSFGQEWGWGSLRFVVSMMVAAVSVVGAARVERRAPFPLVDPALLRSRIFVLANVSFMICMLALFAVGFLLPFYLEELRGYPTLRSGLLLTPLPLTLAVVAPLSGTLSDRVGSRWLAPLVPQLDEASTALSAAGEIESRDPEINSMLRTSASPTMLNAGLKVNVIPNQATAQVDVRRLPTETRQEIEARFRSAINDPAVTIAPAPGQDMPVTEPSSLSTALYLAMEKVFRDARPNSLVVPYMSRGATDGSYLRQKGMAVYGVPIFVREGGESRAHGNDERISPENLARGTELLWKIVTTVIQ